MADPICRWRNPYLATVAELIGILPKEELLQQRAREIVNQKSPYDFYRTPYQLASQLGLYHETNGRYFPKFTFIPTEDELRSYLQNWIIHYCVPNPYTRGFDDLAPISIHSEICRILLENQSPSNWDVIRNDIFNDSIGNNDILVNSINTYSPVIHIHNGAVNLKNGKNYDDLPSCINVDICSDRNNKEYFFDLFPALVNSTNTSIQQITQAIIQPTNHQDINLINEVQNLPNLTQTEKNQIVAARIGQGFFRRNLILECAYCPITLVDETKLLVASHIKPWRSSNNLERVNHKNGILLTPTFDKLFDQGLISFTNDKKLLVSSNISIDNKNRLNLTAGVTYSQLPIGGREDFLNYHRNNIFKQ